MPDTSEKLRIESMKENFLSNQVSNIHRQATRLKTLLDSITFFTSGVEERFEPQNFLNAIKKWNETNKNFETDFGADYTPEILMELFNDSNKSASSKQRHTFIKPCPAANCRGFLSSQYKCGLCETRVCSQCLAIKHNEEDHKCKQEDILSAAMIAKDSKHCPKCAVSIYKIEGCSQMFCTNCNTAFDWRTLQIINKGIHNPHYFEWLHRNGENRTQTEGGCQEGRMIDASSLISTIRGTISYKASNKLATFIRVVLHITEYNVPVIRHLNNEDLRKKYLLKQIDEEHFKDACYQRHKVKKFARSKLEVYEMLQTASMSIINAFYEKVKQIKKKFDAEYKPEIIWKPLNHIFPSTASQPPHNQALEEEIMAQITELTIYFNKSIRNVFVRYKSDAMFDIFTSDFDRHSVRRNVSIL